MKSNCKIFLFISKYSAFFVFFISIFFILILFKYIKLKEKIEMIKYKNIVLEKNYQKIQNIYKNNMYTYHDINNHLIIILNYCYRGENKKAVKYIEDISKPFAQIKQYYICNNIVMDIVLNYKFDEAKKNDIVVESEIDMIGELSIEENDLCVILANLMDNAIEACQSMNKEKKWISVIIKRVEGILLIDISNSCSQKKVFQNKKNRLSKDIPHGYGIKSVKSKVVKYGGNIRWGYEGSKYVVNITFFNVFKTESNNE